MSTRREQARRDLLYALALLAVVVVPLVALAAVCQVVS